MDKKAKKAAEKAMPGWKAVGEAKVDSTEEIVADAVGVDIAALRRKYLPDHAGATARGLSADTPKETSGEHTEFIVMEPKKSTDNAVGSKVVLVRKNKPIGSQG